MEATATEKTTLSAAELAEYIGVKKRTVDQWRFRGNAGPKSYKLGGLVRYKLSTVNAWLAANERHPS